MKNPMDKLPTVISCCFCCFLRAGTVMIAIITFLAGLFFAPNVSQSRGYWDLEPILSNYNELAESIAQMTLGIVSIMLCCVSVFLIIGALCNVPVLIEIFQWGLLFYSITVVIMFVALSIFCFFIQSNCMAAGGALLGLVMFDICVTAYFLIVANSLRVSIKFLVAENLLV